MKVIDLLNKIANNEEVPKKIRLIDVYTCDLIYDEEEKDYSVNGNYYMFQDQFNYKNTDEILNYEIEIIEEDKEIEELENYEKFSRPPKDEFETDLIKYIGLHRVAINILIREINELKKGK